MLLVSVPYAFKAHEAETLGGQEHLRLRTGERCERGQFCALASASSLWLWFDADDIGKSNAKSPSNLATAQGPTNFSGTTTDQIVSAVQSGTGKAIVASSSTGNAIVASTSSTTTTTYAVSGTIPGAGVAILGHASSATAQGYGIQGTSDSTIGIGLLGFATATTGSTYGLKGYSSSTGGTGVRGLSTATTGVTTGISASVASAAGTAGVFNNTAGGKILSGQNNGAEKFTVDGSGNVNARGTFTGSGAGLTGIQFSQLVGNLASSQFSGAYSNAVTLSSTSNVYYGNGSNLTGVVGGGPGSPYYVQNGTARQASANFNISGNGSRRNSFERSATSVPRNRRQSASLSIGSPSDFNLFLGIAAGNVDVSGSGREQSSSQGLTPANNTTGSNNAFEGSGAWRLSNSHRLRATRSLEPCWLHTTPQAAATRSTGQGGFETRTPPATTIRSLELRQGPQTRPALLTRSAATKPAAATQRASATAFRAVPLAKPTLRAATTLSRAPLSAIPTRPAAYNTFSGFSAGDVQHYRRSKHLFRAKRLGLTTLTGNYNTFWARSRGR